MGHCERYYGRCGGTRAELTVLVSTMLWTTEADLCAWSDSLSNINIAEYIRNDGVIPSHVENYDLWLQFHEALQLGEGCSTEFRWISSHVNDSQAGDTFESWVFKWNNIVDELVTKWNINRPLGFLEQHAALDRTLNWWIEHSRRSKQLRQFYFSVASFQSKSSEPWMRGFLRIFSLRTGM